MKMIERCQSLERTGHLFVSIYKITSDLSLSVFPLLLGLMSLSCKQKKRKVFDRLQYVCYPENIHPLTHSDRHIRDESSVGKIEAFVIKSTD